MLYDPLSPLCKTLALLLLITQFFFIVGDTLSADEEVDAGVRLSKPLIMRWHFQSSNTTNLTPATDGDQIYLPLSSGMLISLRAQDGKLVWKTELGGELSSSPSADKSGVYIASEIGTAKVARQAKGALRALGREGGITLWMRTLPMPIRGSLVSNAVNLYGGSSDGRVYAIRKTTGDIVWTMQHTSSFDSHPTLFSSRLYIGSNDGSLFSLDQATGRIYWRYRTRGAIHGQAIVVNGIVYFGSADGYVYAVRETDGRLRWRKRTGAAAQTVADAQTGLIAVSLDNFVYCLSFSKGDNLWKRQLGGRLALAPLIASDGALFTPLSSSAGIVLDLNDGRQLNSLPIGEDNDITASPIIAGDRLLLTTRNGLLAFSGLK